MLTAWALSAKFLGSEIVYFAISCKRWQAVRGEVSTKNFVENNKSYVWRWADRCEASTMQFQFMRGRKMTDKKSVRVKLTDGWLAKYDGNDERSYDFQIGEHNGVLGVIEKRAVSSVISVADEEEIIVMYAPGTWASAYQV